MPPKKGLATTKKIDKYVYIDEDTDSETAAVSGTELSQTIALLEAKLPSENQSNKSSAFLDDSDKENVDPNDLRGIPKPSNSIEPCQASHSSSPVEQTTFNKSILPLEQNEHALSRVETIRSAISTKLHRRLQSTDASFEDSLRRPTSLHDHKAPFKQKPAHAPESRGSKSWSKNPSSITSDSTKQLHFPSDPPIY